MTCAVDHVRLASHFDAEDDRRCVCGHCGLPVGVPCELTPASDTPDALVEARAAELVDAGWDDFDVEERFGWLDACRISSESDLNEAQAAGYLARMIRFGHDKEQQ